MRRVAAALVLVVLLAGVMAFWPRAAPSTGAWLAAARLEPRYERVEGLRLRYVRRGRGPTVVLLHGIASSLYTWKDVLPGLATTHDVIALDFPGFGGSDLAPGLSAEGLRNAVVGLLDRLAIPRTRLVGNSLGGAVACLVAARQPWRVSGLVLIDAAGFRMDAESRPALLRALGGMLGSAVELLPRPRPLVALGLRQVFHDQTRITREKIDEYEAPLLRPGALATLRALLNTPAPSAAEFEVMLGGVRAPTLVIWGAEDRWIPVADAERFAAAIPGARRVVFPACGHMPQEERPEETLRLVEEFLATSSDSREEG